MYWKLIKMSYYIILLLSITAILLFSFVIPHGGFYVEDPDIHYDFLEDNLDPIENLGLLPDILDDAEIIGTYAGLHTIITVYKFRIFESNVYAADVVVRDTRLILSAFAYNIFGGSNYVQTVSRIAKNHNAIFAINSDYASHYDYGLVVRNGELLRDTISYRNAAILWRDGSVTSIAERNLNPESLIDDGVWQLWSFGPVLVKNSEVVSNANDGIPRNMKDNPRSGFGWVSENRYMFVTIDGRLAESKGVNIYEFGQIMLMLNAQEAYNFDGGGSATMYFNGKVINKPSEGTERKVGDCVYVIG